MSKAVALANSKSSSPPASRLEQSPIVMVQLLLSHTSLGGYRTETEQQLRGAPRDRNWDWSDRRLLTKRRLCVFLCVFLPRYFLVAPAVHDLRE